MGFDLYGVNPKILQDYPPRYNEILEKYGKDGWLDWSQDIPDNVKSEYYDIKSEYEDNNAGYYFRNNVWWWRPLWNFVCMACEDFLSEKDAEAGFYNDGKKIAKYKAIKIGKRLSKLIADGTVDAMVEDYNVKAAESKKHNETVQKEIDKISAECKEKHGDLVPADYPEPYKTQWDKAYSKKTWSDSYPFNKENVEDLSLIHI